MNPSFEQVLVDVGTKLSSRMRGRGGRRALPQGLGNRQLRKSRRPRDLYPGIRFQTKNSIRRCWQAHWSGKRAWRLPLRTPSRDRVEIGLNIVEDADLDVRNLLTSVTLCPY
jgi:hypothetical protein